MKIAIKTKIKFQLLVVALFASQLINAQEPGGFDDDVVDNAAPIDDWIIPMLLLATCLLFYILKKRKPSIN